MWDFSSNNMLGIIWLKFSVLMFYFWTSRQQVQFYKLVKSGRMRIETVLRIETVSWEIASQAAFAIQITSNKFILWVLLVFKMIKMSVTSFFFGTFFERLYNTLICRLQNGYNIWEKKSNHYCFEVFNFWRCAVQLLIINRIFLFLFYIFMSSFLIHSLKFEMSSMLSYLLYNVGNGCDSLGTMHFLRSAINYDKHRKFFSSRHVSH